MSSNSDSGVTVDVFELDPSALGKNGINAVRAGFGLVGILAVALGVALLVWPARTVTVAAALVGIYLLVAGIVRLALGIFSSGLSGGHRVLDLLFGLLLLIAGVVILRNLTAGAATLLLLAVLFIGFGWIIEGVMAIVESGKTSSRGAAIAFGIISIVAGAVVLIWPTITALAFAVLVGVMLIVLGLVGVVRAFTFGKNAALA